MRSKANKHQQPATDTAPAVAAGIVIQAKLAVGTVNDPLEHEADAMADKVIGMQGVAPVAATNHAAIQRKCSHCEEEEKVQRKPLDSFIQRKEMAAGTVAPDTVSDKINTSKGNGDNMDGNTRGFMQNRFGADFSNVKIHTGSEAVQMNRELNAKAFTVGSDIYFNEGQYQPASSEGKHLLAHELTHTLQQGDIVRRRPISNRPPHASIPIDTELITDPVERMEFLRTEYEYYAWKKVMERFQAGELEDNDLQNQRLRNRLTGLTTIEINNLITKIKAYQVQRDKDVLDPAVQDPDKKIPITTTKIIEWLEVRKTISTPMPDGATVNSLLVGMIDNYTIRFKDILITVMPDTSGASSNATGPSSNFVGSFSWSESGGKMTNLKKDGMAFNPTQLEITIKTQYIGTGNDKPDKPSSYGKGTTYDDKAEGTTTLRAHEGQHGTDYINYLANTPLPVSLAAGINGNITVAQFNSLLDYVNNITKASCEATDQVGFSQDEFLLTPDGIASGIVSCRPKP